MMNVPSVNLQFTEETTIVPTCNLIWRYLCQKSKFEAQAKCFLNPNPTGPASKMSSPMFGEGRREGKQEGGKEERAHEFNMGEKRRECFVNCKLQDAGESLLPR